jgi:glyceraldehyde-3-phosphate dehydrogenase (NADP+)
MDLLLLEVCEEVTITNVLVLYLNEHSLGLTHPSHLCSAGSKAADDLIQKHPQPHRLKIFLQLEAKNMAIYLPDLFAKDDATASVRLQTALDEAVVGSLSYNGQRCTALKLHFVPKQHADTLVQQLAHRVEALRVGLPDQKYADNQQQSQITPLPTKDRITFLKGLIDDAVSKGAKIVNQNGGQVIGGPDSTLIVPAVLYPVTTDMKVYTEEQFGPIIPVVTYGDIQEVLELGQKGEFGQQVSIFGKDVQIITSLVDGFSAVYAKINLNQQCGRSPDTLPFAGRRSSAMGVMSVKDALREFSIPTVVAYKQDTKGSGVNEELQKNVDAQSNFLQTL